MSMHRLTRGKPLARALFLALGTALLSAGLARAQNRPGSGLPAPRLLILSPAGARAGTTVEVAFAGLHLEDPERVLFSNPGIKAERVPEPPPRIDPKTKKPIPRRPRPGPGTVVKYKITIPANTPLGHHDVRIVNKLGISNPRTFVVGDLPEVMEKEPNNEDDKAQRIDLNTTVNGSIGGGTDVDYYVFKGKKGQRVVVSCLAAAIDSRLQPAVEIYDGDTQLASSNYYNGYNALADAILPADGDYHIRVVQFTHTMRTGLAIPGGLPGGLSDHFYRLTVSTAPWVDAVHPCVVEPGKAATVTVYGRNLPGGKPDPKAKLDGVVLEKVTMKLTAPTLAEARKARFTGHLAPSTVTVDGFEFRVRNATGSSNPILLALATAPVVLDNEANDTRATAQSITLPCEIAGRVEKRRDRDWYTFTAKKGEAWNIEVMSNRLGAPTYPYIRLRSAATKGGNLFETPFNENMVRYERKFFARSEDPASYRFVVPADGKYQLLVGCRGADTRAGPRHVYRVRIAREQPDFRLVAISGETYWPDAPIVYAGGNQSFTVLAFRHDGFNGDIELSAEGLPPGVTCSTQTLAGSVRQTTLVLSAAASAAAWTGPIAIKGTATVGGKKVTHEARTGTIVWPTRQGQNVANISRFDHGTFLAVRPKAPFNLKAVLDKTTVKVGERATIKLTLERLWPDFKGPIQVQVMQSPQRQGSELPTNLRVNDFGIATFTGARKDLSMPVTIGPNTPPGVYNIVLRAQGQAPFNTTPKSRGRRNLFVVQPSTPVTLTVLPKALAVMQLNGTNFTLKNGKQVDVVVRVRRLYGFRGEFKVQLVLPPSVKGIEASEVTIPADQNQVKLTVKTAAGAALGFRGNLLVRAVALYNGKVPTTHEVKFNVNVVK